MTIPIKLRDPNTKVETKQKILINMDVSKKYKYEFKECSEKNSWFELKLISYSYFHNIW